MNRKKLFILTVVIGFVVSHFASNTTVIAKVDDSSVTDQNVRVNTDSVETDRNKRRVPRTASGSPNNESCEAGSGAGLISPSNFLLPLTNQFFPFQSASGASQTCGYIEFGL